MKYAGLYFGKTEATMSSDESEYMTFRSVEHRTQAKTSEIYTFSPSISTLSCF